MDKLKMHTPDLTQAHIARIQEIFPGCVTEARDGQGNLKLAIDFDQLKQGLSDSIVEGPQERYHLNWPGKREALLTANAPIAKTLRPAREESVNFDTTKNLFIEGDNLEALKLLQETYLGKVKMIYIDPPYNTGNDYVYQDDFSENSDDFLKRSNQKDDQGNRLIANTQSNGRFHSDWLSMIYPRLRLAYNLLADDGVIFVSLDDNEQSNIISVGREIFGEKSFVGVFAWRSRTAKADVPYGISVDVEWVICFAKSEFLAGRTGNRKYYISDDFEDKWRLSDLTTNKSKDERPNSYFTMKNPKNGEEFPSGELRTWSVTSDTFKDYYDKGKIVFPGDYPFLKIKRPAFRVFESEDKMKALAKYDTEDIKMAISTYLPENEVGRTEHGSKEIRELFGSQVFSYPKPTGLLKFLIENSTGGNDIIMDFFAGSATTADAVMQTNLKDGESRKFIIVQLPEILDPNKNEQKTAANYCLENGFPLKISELSKERIRLCSKGIKKNNPNFLGDIGFRVLKIDTSNMADVYYTPDNIKQADLLASVDNIKPDRTHEDLLFQVLLDWGVDLTLPITRTTVQGKTVYTVDGNALIACFETGITEELAKELAALKPLRVVFRDTGFASDAVKINAEQIFKQMSPGTDMKAI